MYYLIYGFLYLVSLLPWRVMYFLGDAVYGLVYYILGYRKNVVMENLRIAFPEKSEQERRRIAKNFYHNFVDTFIEAIKIISVSEKELEKRFSADLSILDELYAGTKNLQLHAGHHFNWEIINWGVARHSKFPFVGVYMPIKNKALNRIFYNLRGRYGTILVPATDFKKNFRNYVSGRYALGLVADQNPGNPTSAYWLPFFGKLAPFVTGPEKGARLNDTAVAFGTFYKLKRGHYRLEFTLITRDPNSLPEGELTRRFVSYLEENIRRRPDNYLWSHRRWKWEYKEEYANLRIDRS